MQCKIDFDVREFQWTWPSAKRVVDMIRKAGKMHEFQEALDDWFHHDIPTTDDIQEHVANSSKNILNRIGLDENGNRLDVKKFKVFYRVTGVSFEEVEAENAIEARAKFMEDFFDSPGDPLFCMDRDDIETVVPVCYEDVDGDTNDYEPSTEARKELENALFGAELWSLSRTVVNDSGEVGDPVVQLFDSFKCAQDAMDKDYNTEKYAYENTKNLSHFLPPSDGEYRCYVSGNDRSSVHWHITRTGLRPYDK